MIVLVDGAIQERSTEAAREYLRVTRDRLLMEQKRHGADAPRRRSYQEMERSITAEALARMWPYADLDQVLAP